MSTKEETPIATTPPKKLRFRGDLNQQYFDNGRLDDIFEDADRRLRLNSENGNDDPTKKQEKINKPQPTPSFMDFFKIELTRGYVLEHDEEKYSAKREKIYSFMRIPRELEKFLGYGVLQCADSFLYIHTFLPIRYLLALWGLLTRPLTRCIGLRRRGQRLLTPAEICDLLKGSIWIFSTIVMLYVDTNRVYHIIKSQSIMKLYILYNMLEVGDRLLSAFGQDSIDSLFWTATEPKNRKREHFGVMTHIVLALVYVLLHSFLFMLQATALNVAINSNNKGLLSIMVSNNFVELKGSVFKKFDKNNLFQLTCSDVRERFHLSVLLFIVVIQTMKEFSWRSDHLYTLLTYCLCVMAIEILVDWIKHAFITRFNEIPTDVYKEYTISLAYDMTQTRQKHAFSDHSDLVARRMGFIPYPLGVVLFKAIYSAVSFDNAASYILLIVGFLTLMSCRLFNTICALGKACDLMQKHQDEKNAQMEGTSPLTPPSSNLKNRSAQSTTTETGTSPIHSYPLFRSQTIDVVVPEVAADIEKLPNNRLLRETENLGATALFSNSDVEIDDIRLNENVLNGHPPDENVEQISEDVTRSVPDLNQQRQEEEVVKEENVLHRTHRRSESEPFIGHPDPTPT